MRSRREEYAQRFEELTKQEIKNYNDSLLNTHRALEEFRRKLKDSVDLYATHVAVLSSRIKKVESENKDLKSKISSLVRRLEGQIHDFNKLEKEKIEGDKKAVEFLGWVKREVVRVNGSQDNLCTIVQDGVFMMKRRVEDIFQEVSHCYQKTKADNLKLKEEILSLPSEAEKVKNELLEKAAISAIDNAGIIQEIQVVKNKSIIQESLNQYFHTQIDRLKAKSEREVTE